MNTFDIIMVVWNRKEYTQRTVASLISSGAFRDCERFIIVDNHSTEEGMDDFLKDMADLKKTFVIRRPQNDGWAMAVNDALGLSRAQYLMVSNNDVEYSLGFHQKMFNAFEKYPKIGLLGAWRHTSHGFFVNGIKDEVFREMDDVPAVCWLMPKRAMETIGMLHERGPCFTKGGNGEDSHYVNMTRQAGFLVGVTGEDVATHLDGY